ncbi:hypothetical protein BRE01_66890 [Brevibacillus reuszeri]|uniref:ABC transporter permease n=1 Tax=Brevibacillus reuszeri TaxID=54915 RepID=A0ABQ0U0I8_9BACL|nr:hypothetical protein [Brevibacillus reuszeri]MED1861806.1 hypothetical protein [Brevibacillus reuszeri]GED72987.1 hypothetical protein BRE01_66890 [Brevibacillus reuszeri]
MASTVINQFDQLGLLVIIIGMMSIVVSDKDIGMLTFILTRKVSLGEYLMGKWIGQAAIVAGAVATGILVAGLGVYYIWCLFMVTLTLLMGSLLSRSSGVAVVSLFVLIFLKVATALGSGFQIMNPAHLTNHAVHIMISGSALPHFMTTVAVTLLLIVVFLFLSHFYLSRKELPAS